MRILSRCNVALIPVMSFITVLIVRRRPCFEKPFVHAFLACLNLVPERVTTFMVNFGTNTLGWSSMPFCRYSLSNVDHVATDSAARSCMKIFVCPRQIFRLEILVDLTIPTHDLREWIPFVPGQSAVYPASPTLRLRFRTLLSVSET